MITTITIWNDITHYLKHFSNNNMVVIKIKTKHDIDCCVIIGLVVLIVKPFFVEKRFMKLLILQNFNVGILFLNIIFQMHVLTDVLIVVVGVSSSTMGIKNKQPLLLV